MKKYKLQDYSFKKKPLFDIIKRGFDIVLSAIAIVLLSWLFLIIAIMIKINDPKGPVLFKHNRVGKNGKTIKIYKFRSMVYNAEELISSFTAQQKEEWDKSFKLIDDPRITKIGKFLRKTSLDELPQLFNVFTGRISLVGPRPVIQEETLLYGEHRDLLLKVKPGITCIWAANGRLHENYQDRVDMELYYVCKRSFWLEVKILFKTVISVFKQEGAV